MLLAFVIVIHGSKLLVDELDTTNKSHNHPNNEEPWEAQRSEQGVNYKRSNCTKDCEFTWVAAAALELL